MLAIIVLAELLTEVLYVNGKRQVNIYMKSLIRSPESPSHIIAVDLLSL